MLHSDNLEAPLTWTQSALKPPGAENCLDVLLLKIKSGKSKWWLCFLSHTAIFTFNFTVAILQQATAKPHNIIAHEKGFKFHAQAQTGAYSCICPTNLHTQYHSEHRISEFRQYSLGTSVQPN